MIYFNPDPKLISKPKKKKFLKKKFKPTGEREVFLSIWSKRPHVCQNCKNLLGNEPIVHFFAHIISKKREPNLRLVEENILLLCRDCHYAYDSQGRDKYYARTK